MFSIRSLYGSTDAPPPGVPETASTSSPDLSAISTWTLSPVWLTRSTVSGIASRPGTSDPAGSTDGRSGADAVGAAEGVEVIGAEVGLAEGLAAGATTPKSPPLGCGPAKKLAASAPI